MKFLNLFLAVMLLMIQPVLAAAPKVSVGVSTASAQAPAVGSSVSKAESIPAPPVVAPQAAKVDEAQPTFFDKILAALKSSGGIVAGFLVLFEVVLKLIPTAKPLSILLPVKYVVDSLSAILFWFSNSLLIPMINLANKSDEKLKPETKA